MYIVFLSSTIVEDRIENTKLETVSDVLSTKSCLDVRKGLNIGKWKRKEKWKEM